MCYRLIGQCISITDITYFIRWMSSLARLAAKMLLLHQPAVIVAPICLCRILLLHETILNKWRCCTFCFFLLMGESLCLICLIVFNQVWMLSNVCCTMLGEYTAVQCSGEGGIITTCSCYDSLQPHLSTAVCCWRTVHLLSRTVCQCLSTTLSVCCGI